MRAISGLGRGLNITTTAEGVETIDQFSAARPAAEVAQLLERFGSRASKVS